MTVKLTNRVLAVMVALALLVLSVLVLVEIVWILALGGTQPVVLPYPPVTDYLAELTWNSAPARAILIGLVIVGLLLITAAFRRSKPGLLTLASSNGPVTAGVDRRTLQRAAATAATDVDGISSATARVSRRRVAVSGVSRLRDPSGLQDQLTGRMQSWVDGLNLATPPALTVTVDQGRST